VVSDDLTMEGASVAGGPHERVDAALRAGCDLLLVCNNPDMADTLIEHVSAQAGKAPAGLAALRGKPLPGPRGAFRSTGRYRDSRAAILQMLDQESA